MKWWQMFYLIGHMWVIMGFSIGVVKPEKAVFCYIGAFIFWVVSVCTIEWKE